MLVGSGLPGTRFPGTTRPGGERSDVVAFWPGHGPLQTARGLVPVQITGPERYVEGTRGPALLVERASTNLVSNPRGGAGSTAPWIADGASLAPEAIVDGTAPHGTAIRLAGHSGNIARIYEPIESQAPSLAQGTRYSAHFHARALNAAAIGEPLQALLWETGGASPNQITASLDATFTADWVEHQFTGTIQATGRTGFALILGAPYGQALVGADYGFTDIQTEPGDEGGSYIDGSLGDGFEWLGAEHASPSSRATTEVAACIPGLARDAFAVVVGFTPRWSAASTVDHGLVASGDFALGFTSGMWRAGGAPVIETEASHDALHGVVVWAGRAQGQLWLDSGPVGHLPSELAIHSREWKIGRDGAGSAADAAISSVLWLSSWPASATRRQMSLRSFRQSAG